MANTYTTLANIIRLNDKNAVDLGVSDIINPASLVAILPAEVASNGTDHKYLKLTTAPSAAKRAQNAGLARVMSNSTLITVSLDYYDSDNLVDVAVADGFSGGIDSYLAKQLPMHVRAALFAFETDIIADFNANTAIDAVADTMVVNAGSAAANATTSIYAIRAAPGEIGIVTGNNGTIKIGQTATTHMVGTNAESLSYYVTPIGGYFKLAQGGIFSVGRLCNIGASANKATDLLISSLLAKFPSDRPATHLVMNRQSLSQLQQSRTTYSPTGQPAPFPQDAFGLPIVVSEAISNTQAVVA